jgi:hypothetical protein
MADEPTSGAAPAAASVTPTAPAATTTSPDALAADGNSEPISLEAARKLRSEAEAMRKRLKAYEAAEEAAKLATLSEAERATKERAALQEQYDNALLELQEARIFQAVAQLSAKHNFAIGNEMIVRLLNWDDIEFDDDSGKPKNMEKLLEKLAHDAPDLIKAQAAQPTQQGVPSLPAMNPGRSSITQPGQNPPGRIPRLSDPNLWKR